MAVFKCKMCGGDLEIQEGMDICECMYCGTKQTLPKLNDERRANLYDRANHFRRNNEFDKAMSMYEQILEEDKEDAEAYWSLVLCTYGIEYVEDPASHKRMLTVNRTQYTSVLADENYKAALRYANSSQRPIYEEEAKQIDEILKGILDISNREEPYDVFICYKETDQSGKRTQDSVLANDLYHQLTQEGFKVFFARITLEDKLGSAYEPYIFAALNSAKVMVVIGTKPEYFNAVWVKNEWSRYLGLIKNGAKKVLIPAYKDMDPYDMPQEFSHLQSQDMSKLGFMQDLLRGIKKLTGMDKSVQSNAGNSGGSNDTGAGPLLKRAFLFLEDGDFDKAEEFCEKVLDLDPENGEAYLAKLMVGQQIRKREDLEKSSQRLSQLDGFSKIMRFGNDALKAEVNGYNQKIIERLEREAERQRQIQKQEEAKQNEQKYQNAVETIQKAKNRSELVGALSQLRRLSTYRDAAVHIQEAETKLEQIEKALLKKQRRVAVAVIATVIVIVVARFAVHSIKEGIYRRDVHTRAVELIQNGEYEEAYTLLSEITNDTAECNAVWAEEMLGVVLNYFGDEQYKTALEIYQYAESRMTDEEKEKVKDSLYEAAVQSVKSGELEKTAQILRLLVDRGFMDSATPDERKEKVKDSLYAATVQYISNEELEKADLALRLLIDRGFMDSAAPDERKEEVIDSLYTVVKQYAENGQLEEVDQVLGLLIDRGFMDSAVPDERKEEVKEALYEAAEKYIESNEWENADQVLGMLRDKGFIDNAVPEERFMANTYNLAKGYLKEEKYAKTYNLLQSLNGYGDSEDLMVKVSLFKQLQTAMVGKIITFGQYEQENGVEDIQWYIMDIQDNEYLLLSKDVQGELFEDYSSGLTDTPSWENSNMRAWMNDTFYQAAFNSEEQKYILSKTLTNDSVVVEPTGDGNYNWSIINTGHDTVDRVFALSISEISEIQNEMKIDKAGDYLYFPITHPCLRSSKRVQWRTLVYNGWGLGQGIYNFGSYRYYGIHVGDMDIDHPDTLYGGYVDARPAIWISLDAATE